jgi:hypothetical protein
MIVEFLENAFVNLVNLRPHYGGSDHVSEALFTFGVSGHSPGFYSQLKYANG